MARSATSEFSKVAQVRLLGGSADNKYPLVPLSAITVVERPEEGKESEQLFYNPRSIESMTSDVMLKLRESIKRDGLHNPLLIRAFTIDDKDGAPIVRVELVAGERRFRSISCLFDDNEEVFDWRTKTDKPAREVYSHVPCEVLYNISDEEALRHAWTENDEREALSITDEIHLVERLSRRGLRQDEISSLLGTNVTWVSQTANFRKELPLPAFSRLVEGKISRHVAVQILGFNRNDRDRLVQEAIKVEEDERQDALSSIRNQIEEAEDQEDIQILRARQADDKGDKAGAKRHRKKAEAARKKLAVGQTKQNRIKSDSGVIRQGHVTRGAMSASIAPRKAKVLTRSMIEQFMLELPKKWMDIDKIDPIVRAAYPKEMLALMVETAKGILSGNADPGSIIRKTMVSQGLWSMPEGTKEPDVEFLDIEEGDEEIAA